MSEVNWNDDEAVVRATGIEVPDHYLAPEGWWHQVRISDSRCIAYEREHNPAYVEVKAEARKAVDLPPLDTVQDDRDAMKGVNRHNSSYMERRLMLEKLCRERQLLAALTNIAALQDRVKELEAERDALKAADAWIDVRERLPSIGLPVLIFAPGNCEVDCGYREDSQFTLDRTGSQDEPIRYSLEQVTQWQPLPPPPKPESQCA